MDTKKKVDYDDDDDEEDDKIQYYYYYITLQDETNKQTKILYIH